MGNVGSGTVGVVSRWEIRVHASKTIGDRIQLTGGFTSGFDYLRLGLAVLVVLGHSWSISGDNQGAVLLPFGLGMLRGYSVLALFFCLSGFLVASSLVRTKNLIVFLLLRGLRIAPALCVEIVLSALVLGPLLTAVPLTEYFSSPDFLVYFANMVGWIHYHLPGVFIGHPVPRIVNGSLWTVPYEAECYIALAVLAVAGVVRYKKMFLIGFLVVTAALCLWALTHVDMDPTRATASGRQLVLFFLAGVLLYLSRDTVPWSGWLAIAAAAVAVPLIVSHSLIYLAPLPVAYVTAYVGLQQPKKIPIIFGGDYSYGVYLYAYPIQQAVYQLTPLGAIWWINFLLAMIGVAGFAAFSWHTIEKPILKLKRFIIKQTKTPAVGSAQLLSPDRTLPAVVERGA